MRRLKMIPAPGERRLKFVGDFLAFELRFEDGEAIPDDWSARLRTTLGRGRARDEEIIRAFHEDREVGEDAWHDLSMKRTGDGWLKEIALVEPGFFKAKAYALDPEGRQHWPEGPDFGVSVHPDASRTANTIYCAWPRLFGRSKTKAFAIDPAKESRIREYDDEGYTVIPPSGTLRDLKAQLPHIIQTLGCQIVHLLPVSPTPTTFARMGRFGSPYAVLDMTGIDPALIEFDKRTNGIDQFRELTYETHRLGGRLFIDIVINHTGWGSDLWEDHPDWFLRNEKGEFVSPGAWGKVWGDLVELNHQSRQSWDYLAEVFLTWCRRGVDGFRCDAGYMIPLRVWRYITACVRREFPETIFLLEGLGGPLETTEALLAEGGMHWAYSELFQNYSGDQVSWYLDYALEKSRQLGYYVHYSETHDNNRLAEKGRVWSLLRNRLCGLSSVGGGFGFTCGVEWLAKEKIDVHHCSGLNWEAQGNLVGELAGLNRLLSDHPCFFDGAKLTRLSEKQSPILALLRTSVDERDQVLVLVNTDVEKERAVTLEHPVWQALGKRPVNLLKQPLIKIQREDETQATLTLKSGAAICLAAARKPKGLSGPEYREKRALSAWALACLHLRFPESDPGGFDWLKLADWVEANPENFLCSLEHWNADEANQSDLMESLRVADEKEGLFNVILWRLADMRRIVPVPPDHWLLVEDEAPFRASLHQEEPGNEVNRRAIRFGGRHLAAFHASEFLPGEAKLFLERYAESEQRVEGTILFLDQAVQSVSKIHLPHQSTVSELEAPMVLFTNGRGGMARLTVDLGHIKSKYDCLLGANLHPTLPVDRHVFAKRARVWANADGFTWPLDRENLVDFEPGPPGCWRFLANAGGGRKVAIQLLADMIEGQNTTVLRFSRVSGIGTAWQNSEAAHLRDQGIRSEDFREMDTDHLQVSLVVRIDIEDRSFHAETKRNGDAEYHFSHHSRALENEIGFAFEPAADRRLRVVSDHGEYHHEAEWSLDVPHPLEGSRGQIGGGDAYSPGWFEIPLKADGTATLVVTAEETIPSFDSIRDFDARRVSGDRKSVKHAGVSSEDGFGRRLALATRAYVARRARWKTVIAGYPWFLDWGRDSLICARGLLAAGLEKEVRQLIQLWGAYEEGGTLPNAIYGDDHSNRNTSDAPLWFGVVCEELIKLQGEDFVQTHLAKIKGRSRAGDRTVGDVLISIAVNYLKGTVNDIRVDPDSGLVWSPAHFSWMDTNHPAATPREGYPVEIQVLWIRLLRLLDRLGLKAEGTSWKALADQARDSLMKFYWLEKPGYLADLLIAPSGQPATQAKVDDALRSNFLFAISFGLLKDERARRGVRAAIQHLVVPGGLRSLAPLPVSNPLSIYGHHGELLNDPANPYWGRYAGDEDTRRKPAYHNGTAWTWTFPVFCEALVKAYDFSDPAVAAAQAYLGSMNSLLENGCLGHLPEILDGDAPHLQRGCDAQAWAVTEALRVWKLLNG